MVTSFSGSAGDSGKELLQQALFSDYQGATAPSAPAYPGNDTVKYTEAKVVQGNSVPIATATAVPLTATAAAVPATGTAIPASSTGFIGGVVNPPSSVVNQNFFMDYANTSSTIDSLKNIKPRLSEVNGAIQNNQKEIADLTHKLEVAARDKDKLTKRIHRNEHPRFFHYLQINRKEKVERLKGDMKKIDSSVESWTRTKGDSQQRLQTLLSEKSQLENSSSYDDQLKSKLNQMFEIVVAFGSTPRLQQIEVNKAQQGSALKIETLLKQQVDQIIQMIREGQSLYMQSLKLLHRAQQANNTAQVLNVVDMGERRRNGDAFERMEQMRRDRLINEAREPALRAYDLVNRAWSMFPQEARLRYPSLCSQIGISPLPDMRGANFMNAFMAGMAFGNVGDMMNDMHARRKIEANMQAVDQANRIVETQVALVVALQGAIGQNVLSMTNQLQVLNNQRKEEADNIFVNVRNNIMMGGGYSNRNSREYPVATATAWGGQVY